MKLGPAINLYAISRRRDASLEEIQHAAGINNRASNYLAVIARGGSLPRVLSDAQKRAVARAIRSRGIPRPSHVPSHAPHDGWFEPMPAAEAARLRRLPKPGARRCRNASAALAGKVSCATHFRRFSGAMVGRRCWDHWKKETRVPLTQETLDHFGLKTDPFAKPGSPEARWSNTALAACEGQLKTSILRGEYIIVMGPSGSGKTQLVRAVLTGLEARKKIVVCRQLAPDKSRISEFSLVAGLVWDLIEQLHLPINKPTTTEIAMRRLREALNKTHAAGQMVVLVIEEVHGVVDLIFTFLKRLMEATADGYQDRLSIVAIGQTDPSASVRGRPLQDALEDWDNREWAQRVVSIRIPPLGRAMPAYVAARFERSASASDKVLGDGWAEAVRRALPRERLVPQAVDRLLSDAMRLAHRMGDRRVAGQHIDTVATARGRVEEEES